MSNEKDESQIAAILAHVEKSKSQYLMDYTCFNCGFSQKRIIEKGIQAQRGTCERCGCFTCSPKINWGEK